MMLTWNVYDQTGRRIGRVRARNQSRALVAAVEKYRDRAATILPAHTIPDNSPSPAIPAAVR